MPSRCRCGSCELLHLFSPERWKCDSCGTVVAERPARITGVCTVCGKRRSSTNPFVSRRNLCKIPCYQTQQKKFRIDNAEKLKEYRRQYFKKLDPVVRWRRVRTTIERSPRSFLADQFYHIKARSLKPQRCDPKDAKRRAFDLDIDYLEQLWEKQNGKCALTGMPMICKFNSLLSTSIDRIDSSRGHEKGNVQIVCQWVNRAKNNASNAEFLKMLDMLRKPKEAP